MTNLAPAIPRFEVKRIPEPVVKQLSEREMEILQCYCNGMVSREIAVSLAISLKTVETHRSRLFLKLNSKPGIVNLLLTAMREGIVTIK